MKRIRISLAVLLVSLGVLASPADAAMTNTYQVTGQVIAIDDSKITVENKGKEKFEIARDKDTKMTGDAKVGSKVTVMYRMTAASVEVKPETAAKKKKK
ncbi:MAG: hypothetical protein ABIT01_12090 [Thermoanaerobaculia bacterium]